MGINNKARRAAKARRRAQQAAQRPGERQPYGERAGQQLDDAARSRARVEQRWGEYELDLHRLLGAIWEAGWQPAELVREVRRSTKGSSVIDLLRQLVAVDHARRAPGTLHPRWRNQVEALALPDLPPASGWLARVLRDQPDAHTSGPTILLRTLGGLTALPRLIPPPGGTAADVDIALADATADGAHRSDPVLERVRALLAQAESTSYPAEAEAFTAKAHELMTRHAIDAAMVDGTAVAGGWTTAVRIAIDDPYVDTKSLLLQTVAEHTRCRAVFHSRYAMSTVVGAGDDLAAVQLMFTSLLLQAQQALLAEGAAVRAGARQRSRAYRTSFLFAYANRVGERLAEVSASTVADVEATTGTSVLPVLAHRLDVIDHTVDELFGDLAHSRVNAGWDAAGWASGRSAADRARLGEPDLPPGSDGRQQFALADARGM